MAVTGFWSVYGNLKATLDYADNPDKTTPKEYLDKDLYSALRYAENDNKTDRRVFVGGINCSKQNAYTEMIAVQRRFGMKGKVVAYHGIQSFKSDEVTPEEAFEIGKETARRMFGDKYQVLVTVHLNTDNVHCHFVVNPVSFKNGAKFKNKIGDHLELRKVSDEVCREHGLSVLENSGFYGKGQKKEYWAHKNGQMTHRDMLKKDIDYCLQYSSNGSEFERQLWGLGYSIDWRRLSIKHKGWDRAVRLKNLGITEATLEECFSKNKGKYYFYDEWNTHLPYKAKQAPIIRLMNQLDFTVDHAKDPSKVLVSAVFYYCCKKTRKKQCDKKIIGKAMIEDIVVKTCLTMLTMENCKYIASQVGKYCANDSDNLAVKNLKSAVKSLDTAIENLWNSLERGENTEMITERINARTAEKEKLLTELAKEENKRTVLSEAQIAAFLDYVLNLPEDDINKKRAIINIFVNAIYLYDDHLDIVFNASNQMMEAKNIPIDDIEAALSGCSDTLHTCSSINNAAPP